jgi:hypothetical protein
MTDSKSHNLNIHMYKFDEILGLFDLTYDISIDDMKRAKKKVLMTHPDKSRLSPDYFLFYKKAFDIVVRFYEEQNKQNQKLPTEKQNYDTSNIDTSNKSMSKQVSNAINKMSDKEFQQKFNKLFEENMANRPDPSKNEWFHKDEPIYNIDEKVNSNNMGQVFDKIKQTQQQMVVDKYRGVENLYVNMDSGSRLYDDDDDADNDDTYVTCDPFSKLKFDDLRKVHKDQTVFVVSERDIQKVPQYSSVDHFMRERGKQTLTPLEKQEAEHVLASQDKVYRERMMRKEYEAQLKSSQYNEKNKAVLSNFLRLQNI